MKKWSIFIEIKYSFIFAGYKEKYYYWEFAKLIYKSILILVATLLQQNSFLKVSYQLLQKINTNQFKLDLIPLFIYKTNKYTHQTLKQKQLSMLNAVILFQIYIIFKTKPFAIQNFNNLLSKSAILCASSLNLTQIIANVPNMHFVLEAILIALLIFSNLQFITQLVIGICLVTIQNNKQKRSRIQNCFLYFVSKYPSLFENIQIQQSQIKVSSLLKIKLVKNKVKHLVEYFKQYSFFNQESLQQHFHLQRTQILSSPKLEQQQQASKFTLFSNNEIIIGQHKKVNSFKSMREKWSYYTRKTKESPISINQLDSQDKIQNTHKEITLSETGNMQNYTYNDEFGVQITSDHKLNKNFNQYLTKKQ
ncbi:transmembrane protein, putative (macronuclear) [Tetrahymena thermophila SB210]|uniref:Transmembrane protein, putative n=1 Tax=Tetrahymena thermophila (strain SB210) TaxID=312017 RepID=Q22SY6_TETTS|nr:transmembrane protein, putative [Tetrahymena thermophila SB210]EAR88328.2 transmembrane protein, putative [Tetrahymena thermophila SB210]|eukprot:XP_001008573.2 transmembrane protein, putative [Tetrahymena thermophila SB210]